MKEEKMYLYSHNKRKNNKKSDFRYIKRQQRRLRLIPIFIIMLISIMGATFLPANNEMVVTKEEYIVKYGDTLWSIASLYTEEKDDVRLTIDEIMEDNDLTSAKNLHPGDRLSITVKKNISNKKIR